MSNPRFLIAKYAPDLQRMEPRNIGLMLWHKGRVEWRFLPDENAAEIVNELDAYQEWVEFWAELTADEEIDAPGFGLVPKRAEECIDAVLSTQDGNYLLVDAGFVPAELAVKDVPKAADYLYSELVELVGRQAPVMLEHTPSFSSRCEDIFETAGVEIQRNQRIEFDPFGRHKSFHCHYYVGNGHPDAIFQRASLGSEQSVSHAGLLMHEVVRQNIVSEGHCATLVDLRVSRGTAAQEGFDWLQNFCRVVDINAEDASETVAEIASNID